MANLTLAAKPRTVLGKKVAALRRAGITPANIYGHNIASTAIAVDTHDLGLLLRRAGHTAIVTLSLDGEAEPRSVLVREIRREATTDRLLHVDFLQVSMRERLHVSVPLLLHGDAPVAAEDVLIIQDLDALDVECLPADIPARLSVDVASLTSTGSTIHVRDVALPPGVTVLTDPDVVVVSVQLKRQAEEEGEVLAADEVPVVGEGESQES